MRYVGENEESNISFDFFLLDYVGRQSVLIVAESSDSVLSTSQFIL